MVAQGTPLGPLALAQARARGLFVWHSGNEAHFLLRDMTDAYLLNVDRYLREKLNPQLGLNQRAAALTHIRHEVRRRNLQPLATRVGMTTSATQWKSGIDDDYNK